MHIDVGKITDFTLANQQLLDMRWRGINHLWKIFQEQSFQCLASTKLVDADKTMIFCTEFKQPQEDQIAYLVGLMNAKSLQKNIHFIEVLLEVMDFNLSHIDNLRGGHDPSTLKYLAESAHLSRNIYPERYWPT